MKVLNSVQSSNIAVCSNACPFREIQTQFVWMFSATPIDSGSLSIRIIADIHESEFTKLAPEFSCTL